MEELRLCKQLKQFELYAFCLLPNHFHLLLKPSKEANISQIMQFLKRHFARNANFIMRYSNEGGIGQSRLQKEVPSFRKCRYIQPEYLFIGENMDSRLQIWRNDFVKKHGYNQSYFPRFQWQSSFHDHAIRDERDLQHHWNYTTYNYLKHELPETWKYTSLHFSELCDIWE